MGLVQTLIDAHTLPGQTEGLRVGCGWVGGVMGSRWSVAKGGSKGFEFARGGEGEGKGGVKGLALL